MNTAIAKYPVETTVGFFIMDAGSVVGMATLLATVLHWEVPVDLAVAFAISRMLRRIRLPVDVGFAALLARLYPPLTQVNLLRHLVKRYRGAAPPPGEPRSMGRAAMDTFATIVDKYGLALMVSQRMFVGLASVTTIYAALRAGVDVQSYLAGVGVDISNVGKLAGQWAGGAIMAAPFFPVVVLGAGKIGIGLGRLRARLTAARPPPPPPPMA